MSATIAKFGLLTVSDRASQGIYEDLGGPAMRDYLSRAVVSPHECLSMIVADDVAAISEALTDLVDQECSVILTTGGTGPAPRDVTPEATAAVCHRILPGFGETMRAVSLAITPTAILSRQVAGIRDHCLIINLPGKPSAIAECLDAVIGAIPDCVDLLGGPRLQLAPHISAPRPHR